MSGVPQPPPEGNPPPPYSGAPPPYPGGAPPYTGGPPPYPGAASPYPDNAYGGSRYGARSPVLASYGARLGGWLIDYVLLGVIGYLIDLALNRVNALSANFNVSSDNGVVHSYRFSGLAILLQVALVLTYVTLLCGSRNGQTLGMAAVGVRAVDVRNGAPIGYGRALGRGAFEYLMLVLFFIPWVVDMLWPLWDVRNQTLHDKVSGTVVVKKALVPPGTVYSSTG